MYTSIPIENSVELINIREDNPNVSYCQIKVLYVGDNRNHTSISKEVAWKMGSKLPGSPIVGYYNFDSQDFEEHNRDIQINDNGTFALIDMTKPYGYIDSQAKVWFQKFQDADGVIREYLMTEGQIWTGIYPESQRIIEKGNNQSMELGKVQGSWTGSNNSNERFFIINEAVIDKLCILGENFEPCFEGAQIMSEFALGQITQLRQNIYTLLDNIKGGLANQMAENKNLNNEPENQIVEPDNSYAKNKENEEPEKNQDQNKTTNEPDDSKKNQKSEDNSEQENKDENEDKKKKEYNLSEITEYVELKAKYDNLATDFAVLKKTNEDLTAEIEPLRDFKLKADRKSKEDIISKFFMLSDEDKKDVSENIDKYSLEDIESKLSVIAFRKKVNFDLDPDNASKKDDSAPTSFNLNNIAKQEDTNALPDWVKAVKGM
jgi:hypothetical protein